MTDEQARRSRERHRALGIMGMTAQQKKKLRERAANTLEEAIAIVPDTKPGPEIWEQVGFNTKECVAPQPPRKSARTTNLPKIMIKKEPENDEENPLIINLDSEEEIENTKSGGHTFNGGHTFDMEAVDAGDGDDRVKKKSRPAKDGSDKTAKKNDQPLRPKRRREELEDDDEDDEDKDTLEEMDTDDEAEEYTLKVFEFNPAKPEEKINYSKDIHDLFAVMYHKVMTKAESDGIITKNLCRSWLRW